MTQETGKLSPTVPLQSLLREAEHEPFKMLVEWPLQEVREACLEALRRKPYGWIGDYRISANQIEEVIRAFRKAREELWEKLFDWYIHFAGEGKDFDITRGTRAVEFAIALAEENPNVLHETAKAVCDKLRHRSQLYWEVARVPAFLESLLAAVKKEKGGYSAGAWHLTERAIRRIAAAEDVTFLGHIVELLRLHRDGTIQPDYGDPFARVQNEALLAEAIRRLVEASHAQTPDLSATVGSALRQKAGLEGSVVVEVEYPTISVSAGDNPVAVRVSFGVTGRGQEKLLAAFGDVAVTLQSDGTIELKRLQEDSGFDEWLTMTGDWWRTVTRAFTGTLSCEFLVRSRPGRRRLWLSFKDGKTELAERAIYITFE